MQFENIPVEKPAPALAPYKLKILPTTPHHCMGGKGTRQMQISGEISPLHHTHL